MITGTGSYIPERRITNTDFLNREFYDPSGQKLEKDNQEIINKFLEITTIAERRYVGEDLKTSDIAYLAGEIAIDAAGIDKESLDYIIVAHNFGDVTGCGGHSDLVPSLAARVKHKLTSSGQGMPNEPWLSEQMCSRESQTPTTGTV